LMEPEGSLSNQSQTFPDRVRGKAGQTISSGVL
jgi:hypothetical protein